MGKSLLKANPRESNVEIDQIAIDYKLKLIAFQDELFQSRKKLHDSDIKMAELQNKLDEYLENKKNQITEVMFTAHMNAQRIVSQSRLQTDYIVLRMEDEIRSKQKELELLQTKSNRLVNDIQPDNTVGQDTVARLQVVQDNIRAFRDQIETTKTTDVSLKNQQELKTTKIADIPLVNKGQGIEIEKSHKSLGNNNQAVEAKKSDQPLASSKRRVITRKSDKSTINKDKVIATNQTDKIIVIKDQVAATVAKVPDQVPTPNVTDRNCDAENESCQSASQLEPNERMQLDAFVDVRYYDTIAGKKQMQHHALQVKIEVEVPPDNYSVRYTKVSSDVVSTLLSYDNIVLNDVFPFNFIEPNPQNIAMYFYNCLADMLSLMDLELHSLIMLELPDIQIQVNTRNRRLDNLLHRGEDYLGNIRKSLIPCVEAEPDSTSPLKGTFNRIMKKRS